MEKRMLAESELQYEEPLVLGIKDVPHKNRCNKCGKFPTIAYWGIRKVLMRCENCGGDFFVGEIKPDELSLRPGINRAFEAWNSQNIRLVKRHTKQSA